MDRIGLISGIPGTPADYNPYAPRPVPVELTAEDVKRNWAVLKKLVTEGKVG